MAADETSNPDSVDEMEDSTTHKKLVARLLSCGISIIQSHHQAVKTSEEAAQVRGFSLATGAKAILMAIKNKGAVGDVLTFALFVMSATHRLDSKKAKKVLNCKSLSFATPEQVKNVTGCIPGAVPPFGSLWDIKTYMDLSLRNVGEFIDFNSGLRTDSVRMKQTDYEEIEKPVVGDYAVPPEPKQNGEVQL